MKRFGSLMVVMLVLVAALAVATTSANNQSAGLVSSVLSKMERNRRGLKSLRSGISMEKYNSQLRDSEKFKGIVSYVPGSGREASVRIEWQSPQHEILTVKDGKYVLFRPRLGMAYVGSSNSKSKNNKAGGVLEMIYMSRQQLEARFQPVQDVREETLWGGVSTIHLTLVPKGNASFKYAEIWVDDFGMPIQTKIVEKNDDATTMRLTGLEKNAKISADDFNQKLDGVRIVKG